MFHNSKCTRTTQYHCFFSRRHGINGHLRSLCYGRKWKCTETTVKRLVSYSQYGAPGKPGNPLFYFLCTKREFPFQSIHHDRAKCGRHRTTNWINAESNNRTPYGPFDWNWKGLTHQDMIYPYYYNKPDTKRSMWVKHTSDV